MLFLQMANRTEYRKRSIFIASDTIPWFTSSTTVNNYLGATVMAEEGFDLAYGIRSIGFNSTAMNISERLNNNRLVFRCSYDNSEVQMIHDPTLNYGADNSNYNLRPITNDERDRLPLYIDYEIVIPDAHYTFSQLLAVLTTSRANPLITIPSGYYVDYQTNHKIMDNVREIPFRWTESPGGFQITIGDPDSVGIVIPYTDANSVIDYVDFKEVYPLLSSVSILPSPMSDKLFNLLFTNYNASDPNIPISQPPHINRRGLNPPQGIYFRIESPESITRPPDPLLDPILNRVGDETQPFAFFGHITELGNEELYDTPNGVYPNEYTSNYYVAYYKPNLDPNYLDIEVSLPNPSIDSRGHSNKLTRLFTLGANNGNTSLFQYWDSPKMNVLDGIPSFTNIQLNFTSENDKWDFFNLEFSIELIVCEYMIESAQDQAPQVDLNIPASDPITDAVMTAGGGSVLTPFPSSHFSYRTGTLHPHFHKRFRR